MDSVIKKIVEETPNDMELGEKIREMYWKNRELQKQYINMKGWIYESPDGGKTIYRRKVGESKRELISEKDFQEYTRNRHGVEINDTEK